MKTILATLLLLSLCACAVGPKSQPPVGNYDFGLPADQAPRLALKSVAQIEVAAPRWLDSVNLYYRLAYSNPAQPRVYTQTKWVMPPPYLVEARLKERAVAGGAVVGGAGPVLRVELDEFSQVFASTAASTAVLRARVTLVAGREVLRQKAFAIDEPAASADGPGGAAALRRAAERFVDAVLQWAGGE
jgi:cholesterol transport system auxiliary component